MNEVILMQTIPAPVMYAVFAEPDGNTRYEKVVLLGTLELLVPNDDRVTPRRVPCGYVAYNGALAPADMIRNFCGYETEYDIFGIDQHRFYADKRWIPRVAAKLKALKEAEEKAKQQKIVVVTKSPQEQALDIINAVKG